MEVLVYKQLKIAQNVISRNAEILYRQTILTMWLTILLPLLGVITENIIIFQLYNSFQFLALQEAKNCRGLTKLFLCVLAKASVRTSSLRTQ